VEFVPALALAALILKFVDFLRYLKARDVNGAGTQVIVWAAGVGGLLLAAQTQFAAHVPIGDVTLDKLGVWDIVFAGLTAASVASAAKDVLKSVDNNNTSKIPTLFDTTDGANRG
jgi:hypothetical protein